MTLPQGDRSDQLLVVERWKRSSSVVEFVLERPDGRRLPDWAPGAHIDVILPSGKIRQYSLCGDRWNAHQYRIAVQYEPRGAGGSQELHDQLSIGDAVSFGGPRNNFRFAPAKHYRFIVGGIGITAALPMINQADLLDLDWARLYRARTAGRMASREVEDTHRRRLTYHRGALDGRNSIRHWLRAIPADTAVCACGPEALLGTLRRGCQELPSPHLRPESFT